MKGRYVTIERLRGINNEYIIKDKVGITLGIVTALELSQNNKNAILRIKLYRKDENQREIIREVITLLLDSLFTKINISKVSFLIDEEMNYNPFIAEGFSFEGVLNCAAGSDKDEYIFGIDKISYLSKNIMANFSLMGNNIELKILTPEHCEDMAGYYLNNKEHLSKFEPLREEQFYTSNMQRKILAENYKQYLNGNSISLGIFKNSSLIGKLQCSNIVEGIFKSGIIGYSIDKDNQNKGYMSEAMNIFIDYIFNEVNLHRVEASTLVDNEKSQKVLLNCGFEKLGLNRKYLFINGEWKDHITFYKINENF